MSERPGLSIAGRLPVRVAAAAVVGIIVGGLLAWAFRPAQTLRRTARTSGTTARRRTPRIPLFGSVTAAVVIGAGLAALATWIISGAVFTHAARAGDVDVVRAALPAIAGAVIAVALVVVYRRQNDTERAHSRSGAARRLPSWATRTRRCASPVCTPWPPPRMKARLSRGASNVSMCCAATCVCHTIRTPAPTTSASSSPRQRGRRPHRPSTSTRRGARRSARTTARCATRSFGSWRKRLARTADTSWSGNDFDLTGVLFEDASFGGARFSGASFVAPTEWKNVDFDWDNPPGGTQPAIPRCITPRPWPPYLVARESGTGSPPAGQDKDDSLDG